MREAIDYLLRSQEAHPVLVDVGASVSPPKIWEKIARHSIYVGFDPDLRDIQEIREGRFYKSLIINEAVTSDKDKDEVLFYLTNSPYCSSTLKPDAESLANFIFSDLFIVEREERVPTTSLDSVMDRLSLPRLDWFKTDSQGTDLRLFNSLRDEVRAKVLAVDIEPGLLDAYIGEDLFVDAHRDLTQNGFWLSNLVVHGVVRVKETTRRHLAATKPGINDSLIEKTVKRTPGWVEARYLRTIEWLAQGDFDQRDYVLLWVFALLDKQLGFALDLAVEYERIFGRDDVSQLMQDEPTSRIRGSLHIAMARSLFRWMRQLKHSLARR
jgi:hypothetical protein